MCLRQALIASILLLLRPPSGFADPGPICYECWEPNTNEIPQWPPPSYWSNCKSEERIVECVGNMTARECFSVKNAKTKLQAKGCATTDLIQLKIRCHHKLNNKTDKNMHCKFCTGHFCNTSQTNSPKILIFTIGIVHFLINNIIT